MKILYLGNQLYKHGFNKTTIETLSVQMAELGFEIVCASDKKSFFWRILDMVLSVIRYRNQVSYILMDTYSTKAFWYAFLCSQLARLFKIKYIPILHGGNLPYRLENNPKLCQMVFANAYKNVAPSGYLKQAFEKVGYTNLISIPNAIPIHEYEFKKRTTFSPKLLWVRAFATIYNPEMAVAVLYEVLKTYPHATLTMVGPDKDGSMATTKAYAESKGLQINFTGKLAKEEWWQLASEHDIFINTTHFDNTPVSVMEAMALGLPVVSTNVGGIPFLLTDKENALLVQDNDVEAMTKSILDLISQPERSFEMTQNARRFIAQMDWEVIKQKWKALLA